MTVVAEPVTRVDVTATDVAAEHPPGSGESPSSAGEPTAGPPLRLGVLVVSWLVITVAGVALVLRSMGPMTEQEDQQELLLDYRAEIEAASNQAFGLPGIELPTQAPVRGSAVGIVEVTSIDLRRVVVEGSDPDETRTGPGHVVGSAGLGQPGNAVVVAHRTLFGGAFGDLDEVEEGDRILVTTVQGVSVYAVEHVGTHQVVDPEGLEQATGADGDVSVPTTIAVVDTAEDDGVRSETADEATEPVLADGPVTVDQLFGPSADDRLTLVTSASPGRPWQGEDALVVVARLEGTAFQPTPQGGRTEGDDGRRGDAAATAPLLLALAGYLAAVVTTVWVFRTISWRTAYLVSLPLLIALTVVLAEQFARFLPAWS